MDWLEFLATNPSFYTIKPASSDVNKLKTLKTLLSSGESVLTLSPDFEQNTLYLARFIKQYTSQFRSLPLLQQLHKIKSAFVKLTKNNCLDVFHNVYGTFPLYLGSGIDLELPSRRYYEYFLAKILAHSKIMTRIVVISKEAALHFVQFLQRGHFIEMSTMMTSLLGQIWQQSRTSLKHMAKFYNEIYKFREQFPLDKNSKEIRLPATLEEAVGDEWRTDIDVKVSNKINFSNTVFKAFEEENVEKKEEESTKEEAPKIIVIQRQPPAKKAKIALEEVGVPISRDIFNSHSITQVNGKKSLDKFLKQENIYRIQRNAHSLTSKVSQFHWERFRREMESNSKSGVNIRDLFILEWNKLINSG